MRSLLLVALTLSAVTPSRDAEACGNYRPEPEVFRLSSHVIVGKGVPDAQRRRTFVLLPRRAAPEDGLAWQKLAPQSFDATQIADGPVLASPVTVTLVGPAGTKVVASTKQVFLSRSWEFERPIAALEVPAVEGFAIAIEGNHPNAKWTELERVNRAKNDGTYVSRVDGSDVKLVSFYSSKARKYVTMLKVGEKNHGEFSGHALGAVTNDGVMSLVVADGSRATKVYLAARG